MDEILRCYHLNENYWAVLSCGTVYYALQSLWMKSYGVTFQIKPLLHYFHMVLFVFQYFTNKNLEILLNSDFGHLRQWKRKSLELSIHWLHIFKAFWLIARQPGFKQNGICPKLRSQQRHVTIHPDKKVDTLAAFLEVRLVLPKGNRTVWTRECPTWSYLKKRKKTALKRCLEWKSGRGKDSHLKMTETLQYFYL